MKTLKLDISTGLWALLLSFGLGQQMTYASDTQGASVEFHFDGMLGPMLPPVPWEFNQLNSIAVAPDGNVWVEDYGNNVVYRLNADDGSILGQIKRTYYSGNNDAGLGVAADGSLWTRGIGGLQHLKPDGSIITQFATGASFIGVANDGGVWVENERSISHLNAEGVLLSKFENNCLDFNQVVNPRAGQRAADGSLWLINNNDYLYSSVHHLNVDGSEILSFNLSSDTPYPLPNPSGIAVASDDSVWVVDRGNHRLQHFKADGSFIAKIGSKGSEPGQFNNPEDIVFIKDGSFWVSDSYNYRLQHFTAEGNFIAQIKTGEPKLGDALPSIITLAPDGSLWVAFGNSAKLLHLNADGSLIRWVNSYSKFSFVDIEDIFFVADGSFWVTQQYDNYRSGRTILHFTADGTYIEGLFSSGNSCRSDRIGLLYYWGPIDIAEMADGSVWVVDTGNHRIQHFDAHWNFLALVGAASGSAGAAPSQFNNPTAIAVAKDNSIWVVDKDNHRLQHFTADGTFIRQMGSQGSAPGQFNSPRDVALAADGSLWVTDTGNRRIQQFFPDGRFIKQYGRLNNPLEAIYEYPAGMAFAADGSVWIGNSQKSALLHITLDGNVIEVLGGGVPDDYWAPSAYRGNFPVPQIITTATDGSVWKEDIGNHRIQRVDTNGNIIAQAGSEGQLGQLRDIGQIKTAKDGSVWVEDGWYTCPSCSILPLKGSANGRASPGFSYHRLQHFTADGQFTAAITSLFNDNSKDFSVGADGSLWLIKVDYLSNGSPVAHIQHIGIDGRIIQQLGASGSGVGQFKDPRGIAIAPDDTLWVLDAGNKRIQKFAPQTQLNLPAEYDGRYDLLNLYDVDVAGSHYQATLHYQDGLYKLLTLNPASNFYSPSAGFDASTNLLTIPLVRVYGQDYQASFKLVDNYLFQLLSASPK